MLGAILGGAAIGALGNIYNGYQQSKATKEAANAYNEAAANALAAYQNAYNQAYGAGSYNDQTQQLGLQAAQNYNNMLGNQSLWDSYINGENAYQAPAAFSFTAQDLYSDPSYQFRLQQGQNALAQNQVAGGLNLSGAAAKEMNDYSQNVASQEYSNAYNRANSQYNADRNFDYSAWLNNAKQYYSNLTSQLNGYNTLSSQGIAANNNQAAALQGLAGNQSNAYAQGAASTVMDSNASNGLWGNSVNTLANIAGYGVANLGYGGDNPYAVNGTGATANTTGDAYSAAADYANAARILGGYNPYEGSSQSW